MKNRNLKYLLSVVSFVMGAGKIWLWYGGLGNVMGLYLGLVFCIGGVIFLIMGNRERENRGQADFTKRK